MLVHTTSVVILRRSGNVEALLEEEAQRFLVRRGYGAVDLTSTEVSSVLFGVLQERASDIRLSSVVGAYDEGADLYRPLLLLHDMDDANLSAVNLGDEHTLSSREVTHVVDAALDVCVEDALRVRTVVAAVEGAKRPLHQVGNPLVVPAVSHADDALLRDQRFGHDTPSVDCYDSTT